MAANCGPRTFELVDRALQGKICPSTSQFNGGTSHLDLKRWDGRTTRPEASGTAAGTMLGLDALELWEGDLCQSQSSPPELWEEGGLLTTSGLTGLYDGAKEAEADTDVGGNSGRSGQGESSQSDGSEQADVERLERHRRNGR